MSHPETLVGLGRPQQRNAPGMAAEHETARPSLRLRLKRFTVLAAYKQAVERAELHQASGHRRRARRAQTEADRLRSRLQALGGQVPPATQLNERITAFTRPDKAGTQDR